MKILHTTKALWTGGIETMVRNLANQMCDVADVSVCTVFKANDDEKERLSSSVKVFDLGYEGEGKPIREIFNFYRIVKQGHYDIVNLHGFFYFYMYTIFRLHKKVKFVYTLHSDAYHEGTSWDNKLFRIKRFFFRKGWMKAVCISSYAEKTFKKMYGCQCELIHNGIPKPKILENNYDIISGYKLTDKTRVFIHPARITKAKNQFVLCKVFDRLIKNGYDVVLLIAGANQDNSIFESINPFFSDRIMYLGIRNDIVELLLQADGMCLPSVFEGFGLVIVEAFSVGCIPVCTPVGGMIDLIKDGWDGILSQSTSEDDYYDAMVRLLSMNDNQVTEMKEHALGSFAHFDIELTSMEYLHLYDSLLKS